MSNADKDLYEFSDFRLDVAERLLLKKGERVALPEKAFEILCLLIRQNGHLVGKDELLEKAWAGAFVEENNLDKNISYLRQALGERKGKQKFIETVRGRGYRFIAGVRRIEIKENQPPENSPFDASLAKPPKSSDNHHYVVERQGNVLAVQDWRARREDETGKELQAQTVLSVASPNSAAEREKEINQTYASDGAVFYSSNGEKPATTVAVLPFKTIDVETADRYLGAGLADALIVGLSKIGGLRLRPTASVMAYANIEVNAVEAGRDLKVAVVVDGKIKRIGEDLRITVQAIRVADGSLLWAEKFDGAAGNLFALEDRIAAIIADRLERNPNAENAPFRLTTRGTKSLAAHQAFLKARFHFHQGSPDDYQKSNAFYLEAVRLDPDFAEAHAGLADEYIAETIFGLRSPLETFAETEKAVRKAVELNPASAQVNSALANFNLCFNCDLPEAERRARRAIELNPSFAHAYNLLGQSLMFRGFFDEAETALKQALELDPLGFWHDCMLTILYFLRRDYEQAVTQASAIIALNPHLFSELLKRCWSLTELGRYDEAFALYERMRVLPHGQTVDWFVGYTHAVAGNREKANELATQLKALSEKMYLSPYFIALVHAGLNETTKAVEYLEQALENRDPWTIWMATDPRLDNLRSDSRFCDLANRVVPKGARMTEKVSAPANSPTPNEPNEDDALMKTGAIENRIVAVAPPIKSPSKTAWLAATCIALAILASGIGFALYKFTNPAPMQFEANKTTRLTSSGRVKAAAVSPDGKFIIYAQEENNEQQSLWMRHIGSESNVQIVAPANSEYRGLSISPDGNSFYFSNEKGTLYQMPVLGGTAKKIADGLFESSFSTNIGISPDGKQIAFVRYVEKERALYIANADGTNESKLYSFEQQIRLNPFPAWSPDGKVIACPFIREGEHNILAVQVADGTSALISPQNWIVVRQITWMPDSKSMLVSGVKNGLLERRELWQISYPSGEVRPITNDTIKYSQISLTSDGRYLMADRIEQAAHIWTMPTDDAGRARQLTTGFEKLEGTLGLDWTPDGKIVYGTRLSGKLSIWMMEADGDKPKQVVDGSYGSAVSPDGRYVVYQKRTSEDNIGLWRTDLSNREEKQLTKGVDHHWTFSPDGKWIVFTRWGERVALWKVPIEGGEQTQIFDKGVTNSAVSPDGKTIAVTYGFTSGKITLIPFGGGEIIKTFDAKFEVSPETTKRKLQWTPDGRGIYFIALTDGVSNIWRQPIDGSPPAQVTDFKDGRIFNFAFSMDGSQLVLSRGTYNSDVVLIENANSR